MDNELGFALRQAQGEREKAFAQNDIRKFERFVVLAIHMCYNFIKS